MRSHTLAEILRHAVARHDHVRLGVSPLPRTRQRATRRRPRRSAIRSYPTVGIPPPPPDLDRGWRSCLAWHLLPWRDREPRRIIFANPGPSCDHGLRPSIAPLWAGARPGRIGRPRTTEEE